jgi:hypothetical protein
MLSVNSVRLLAALLSCALAFESAVATSFAQTNTKPLVELYTDNTGLWFPAGKTLYATIFEDGQIEYMDTAHHDLVTRHKQLSAASVGEVKQQIASGDMRRFKGVVESEHQERWKDYQTSLKLTIHYPRGLRSVTFLGFEPENGRPFPEPVNEFLCMVDELKGVEYRLSAACK